MLCSKKLHDINSFSMACSGSCQNIKLMVLCFHRFLTALHIPPSYICATWPKQRAAGKTCKNSINVEMLGNMAHRLSNSSKNMSLFYYFHLPYYHWAFQTKTGATKHRRHPTNRLSKAPKAERLQDLHAPLTRPQEHEARVPQVRHLSEAFRGVR